MVYRVKRLPAALGVSFAGGEHFGRVRNRRRHSQGSSPERLVRRADARGGRDQRADDRRHRRRLGADPYAHGYVNPPLAAGAVLGVLVGSRAGLWVGGRARAKWLKLLMAAVLAAVSMVYLRRSLVTAEPRVAQSTRTCSSDACS